VRPSTSSGPDDVELPRESQVHDIRCKYRKGAAKRKIKRLRHSLISKLDFVSALGDRIGEKNKARVTVSPWFAQRSNRTLLLKHAVFFGTGTRRCQYNPATQFVVAD
jgi:hypothetical protein